MSSYSPDRTSAVGRSRSASAGSVDTITRAASNQSRLNSPTPSTISTSDAVIGQPISIVDPILTALIQQHLSLCASLRLSLRYSLHKLDTTRANTRIQIAKLNRDINAQQAAAKSHFAHRDTSSFEIDLEMFKSLLAVKGGLEMLLVALEGAETFTGEEVERMSGSELTVQVAKVNERMRIVVALEDKLWEGEGSPKR